MCSSGTFLKMAFLCCSYLFLLVFLTLFLLNKCCVLCLFLSSSTCFQLTEIWSDILLSASKRSFLLEFSRDPNSMMERLIRSKHFDVMDYSDDVITSTDFLREYEIADKKAEFYRQVGIVEKKREIEVEQI